MNEHKSFAECTHMRSAYTENEIVIRLFAYYFVSVADAVGWKSSKHMHSILLNVSRGAAVPRCRSESAHSP